MVFGLSTSHEIGLAIAGALFIIFALLSSFVFPRFDPDFPGRKGLRWYIPLCFVFFIGMLGAVLYFGREQKTAEASAAPGTTATAPAPSGNAAAGKPVFTSAGCVACHTFTPAGSKGTVGPDLDKLADYAKQAGEPVAQFAEEAILHPPPKYVPPGYANTMPTTFGQSLTKQQIADLVAFLTTS
jgi:cytochrome c551/c552